MKRILCCLYFCSSTVSFAQSLFDDYEDPSSDVLQYSLICQTPDVTVPRQFDVYPDRIVVPKFRHTFEIKERKGSVIAADRIEKLNNKRNILFLDESEKVITEKNVFGGTDVWTCR